MCTSAGQSAYLKRGERSACLFGQPHTEKKALISSYYILLYFAFYIILPQRIVFLFSSRFVLRQKEVATYALVRTRCARGCHAPNRSYHSFTQPTLGACRPKLFLSPNPPPCERDTRIQSSSVSRDQEKVPPFEPPQVDLHASFAVCEVVQPFFTILSFGIKTITVIHSPDRVSLSLIYSEIFPNRSLPNRHRVHIDHKPRLQTKTVWKNPCDLISRTIVCLITTFSH